MGPRVLVGELDFGAGEGFFFFCLVKQFIELDFFILKEFRFWFDRSDDGRIDQTKGRKKEEGNKMTQNEEKAQGLMWVNKNKYCKSMKHHK